MLIRLNAIRRRHLCWVYASEHAGNWRPSRKVLCPNIHRLTYIEKGRGCIAMQFGTVEYAPGDLLLFLQGKTYRNMGDQTDIKKIAISFMPLSGDVVIDERLMGRRATQAFYLREHTNLASMPLAVEIIKSLAAVQGMVSPPPPQQLRANVEFERLLVALSVLAPHPPVQDPAMATAIGFLESRLAPPWTLDELAAAVHISRRALTKRFKAATGRTIADYERAARLVAVARIMQGDPHIPLKEVAAATGFADEFHLSKLFKRHYGISPRQHRQRPR